MRVCAQSSAALDMAAQRGGTARCDGHQDAALAEAQMLGIVDPWLLKISPASSVGRGTAGRLGQWRHLHIHPLKRALYLANGVERHPRTARGRGNLDLVAPRRGE